MPTQAKLCIVLCLLLGVVQPGCLTDFQFESQVPDCQQCHEGERPDITVVIHVGRRFLAFANASIALALSAHSPGVQLSFYC